MGDAGRRRLCVGRACGAVSEDVARAMAAVSRRSSVVTLKGDVRIIGLAENQGQIDDTFQHGFPGDAGMGKQIGDTNAQRG